MSTPVASGTLYASAADLQAVMAGTDLGTGTGAQLTEQQLTLALYAASNRVSVFAGNTFDGSTGEASPPAILHDLTLDLACFWALATYLKNKEVPATHPIFIKYKDAMSVLEDVRDGKILLDPVAAPGIGSETGTIINRIPPVFTGADSNTRLNPRTGTLEADVPLGQWAPMGVDWADGGSAWYQG